MELLLTVYTTFGYSYVTSCGEAGQDGEPRMVKFYSTLYQFEQELGARMVLKVIVGYDEWSSTSNFEYEKLCL